MLRETALVSLIVFAVVGTMDAQTKQVSRDQMLEAFRVNELPRVVEFNQAGLITEISPGTAAATIAPDRAVFARIGTVSQPIAPPLQNPQPTSQFVRLPIGFATMDAHTSETRYVQAILEVEHGGLQYAQGEYRGRIGVALEDSADRTASRQIRPEIRLSVTADPASTTPTDISLDHTNLPFERIDISTRRDIDSITVVVRTQMDPQPSTFQVPAIRPALLLDAMPSQILGLGLDEAILTITIDQTVDHPVSVRLTSKTGRPTPHEVSIPQTGAGTSVLRSGGLGVATVEASATMFNSDSASLTYIFPYAFLISSLLGGALGGIATVLLTEKEMRKVTWQKRLIGGICVGLIAAVLFTVGVNLTGFSFKTDHGEALFFGVSALASIAGLAYFEKKKP